MPKKSVNAKPSLPSTDPRAEFIIKGGHVEPAAEPAPAVSVVTELLDVAPAPEDTRPRGIDFLVRGVPPEMRRWLNEVAAERQLKSGGRSSTNAVVLAVLAHAMRQWHATKHN